MTRRWALALVTALGIAGAAAGAGPTSEAFERRVPPADAVRAGYLDDVDTLANAIEALAALSSASAADSARLLFQRARAAYKRAEYLVAYNTPEMVVALNGAPIPRVDDHVRDGVLQPTGLQVVEAALFPDPSADVGKLVRAQLRWLRPAVARIRTERGIAFEQEPALFDAMRQEIARVSVLGVAGFDATISGHAITESADALRGVRRAIGAYRPGRGGFVREQWMAADTALVAAIGYLASHPDFESFDRLAFIADYANPASRALDRLQQSLGVARIGRTRSWSYRSATLFDAGAMDPYFYAPSDALEPRADAVALGRALFFDRSLSRRENRSCGTCHDPARAFTDGRRFPVVDPGHGVVRNTPTLVNAAFQPFQFADQRARSLEDQIAAVLANPREMNLPLSAATGRVRTNPALASRFATVFKGGGEPVTERRLQLALGAYVRSLGAMTSRFDRAVRGDAGALTPEERRGFNLFMGKALCGTCHFAPLFGGTTPPDLLEAEPEVIGVPARVSARPATLDPDPGRSGFDRERLHLHAFKTPTLRNVALTAPYMHNGVYRTLDEVVDFYDGGGGAGLGMTVPNLTLPADSLHLSRQEKRDLVAFLEALTDTAYAR